MTRVENEQNRTPSYVFGFVHESQDDRVNESTVRDEIVCNTCQTAHIITQQVVNENRKRELKTMYHTTNFVFTVDFRICSRDDRVPYISDFIEGVTNVSRTVYCKCSIHFTDGFH